MTNLYLLTWADDGERAGHAGVYSSFRRAKEAMGQDLQDYVVTIWEVVVDGYEEDEDTGTRVASFEYTDGEWRAMADVDLDLGEDDDE